MIKPKLLLVGAVAVLVGAVFLTTFSFENASAAVVDADTSKSEIQDYSGAVSYVNNLCGWRVFHNVVAAYPTNAKFDTDTGILTYDINLVWRSCGIGDTRAFAVTGYSTEGISGLETCPVAGWYHNVSDPTHDCIKYDRSDDGILTGQSKLSCDWRSPEATDGYACVNGGSDPSGPFRKTIERQEFQPSTDANTSSNHSTQSLSGQVPDWSTATLSSGKFPFYRAEAVCTYAKLNNEGEKQAARQCVSLRIDVSWTRYNYSLTPTITAPTDNSTVDSGSGTYLVKGNIHNNGPTGSKQNTEWALTQVVYSPAVSPIPNRSGGDSNQDPCAYFSGGDCTTLDSGSDPESYASGGDKRHSKDADIKDYAVGTKVCFVLSVRPYSHANNNWRHSPLSCLVVSKSPKANVLGGDLVVGRGSATNSAQVSQVNTSVSRTASNGYFGSWVEYGIIPTGIVTGMASGSGFVGGAPTGGLCAKSSTSNLSILTFTNSSASGSCSESTIGRYKTTSTAPSIAARFFTTTTTPQLSGAVDITGNNLAGLYKATGTTLSITSSGSIPKGRWVVINAPNTTVTIGGDIRYTTGALTSIADIPQVVIIAKNIIIADSVTNIDAWLVAVGSGADGRINTCGAGGVNESTSLTSKICASRLTVNGPVSANHLILRRTAGAGPGSASGNPAEVFNLRADAYIWATGYSPGTGRLPTVTTKEIPPRF